MVVMCGAAAAQTGSPPGVEKGWNLVSSPCDVSLDELHQKLGNDEILVFAWDGQRYVQANAMERGRGYFLNDNAILNSSIVCKNETPLPEGFAVQLHEGWNLIGNPYHRSITFQNAFGSAADLMGAIYAWQGNRLRLLDSSDHMIPFRGYWVHAQAPASLSFAEFNPDIGPGGYDVNCNPFVINRVMPANGADVTEGDTVILQAMCTEAGQETDVTAAALWSVDNESVLVPRDAPGEFGAAGQGDAVVMVNYLNNLAYLDIAVMKYTNPLVSLSLTADKTALNLDETAALKVIGTYKDGTTKDLSSQAQFTVTGDAGIVIDGVFAALSEGSASVTAAVDGVTSNSLGFTVRSVVLEKLHIEAASDVLEIHETTVVLAKATYNDGSVKSVTANVAWQLNPSDAASIEKSGRFNPLKLGTVNVSATLDGMRSNTLSINVTPKTLRWLMPYSIYGLEPLPCPTDPRHTWCYTHGALRMGEEGKVVIGGEFDNGSTRYLPPPYKFELSDTTVLNITSDGVITALKPGLCGIRAYVDGVYSEWLWLIVYEQDKLSKHLLLEFSNEETIVEKGHSINIGATYYEKSQFSNSFISHNVTKIAKWTLGNGAVGSISEGVFTGAAAGQTSVSASFNGFTSNSTDLRVWEPSHLEFCDPNNPNEQSWNDGLSVATLETSCRQYNPGETVDVCFNAELRNDVERRVLDVCMDLYIYDENQNLVRTFQDRNCSPAPLFRRTQGYHPVYQYCAGWDRRDDGGNAVPPGKYTAVARYYILYCPVLKVTFEIK